jgi:6-phosphogluconolactonase
MKNIIYSLLLLFSVLSGICHGQKTEKIYVGTFTSEGAEGIYQCSFNSETGDIALDKTFKSNDDPSFLKISPDKKNY